MVKIQDPNESPTFGNSLLLRVDGAIGAMSLSPNGRDAVLAGRRGLFIIDLDDPFTTPRWLRHITSWEVADVQWSPHHMIKPSWCISTSNQKALLWDLARPSNDAILNVLHLHTRAITDINFHPSDPEILATCSIDTFILSWDMRTPRKPVAKWAEWRAGATQVKWNHTNPYEIASSHDNSFYIWDSRKGALPLLKVANAHGGKINGIDFSSGRSKIITCSNDKTIKCWNLDTEGARSYADSFNFFDNNISSNLRPSVVLEADFPISRARTLPFGSDMSCGIMPLRGGDEAIHIMNYDAAYREALATGTTQVVKVDPTYSFKGHNGAIKDFLWRTRNDCYNGFESKYDWKDYQLVTWSSQDYDLKLWAHNEKLYKDVNYNPSHQTIINTLGDECGSEKNTACVNLPVIEKDYYNYNTYCMEPPVNVENIIKQKNGDVLSAFTLLEIQKREKHGDHGNSQLNHLDWIAGVRMGRAGHGPSESSTDDIEGPYNFGEEVSIVGHKFPKIRFEKISVSTGELVISLRGPCPIPESNNLEESVSNNDQDDQSNIDKLSDKDGKEIERKRSESLVTKNNTSLAVEETDTNTSFSKNTNEEVSQEQRLIFIRIKIKFPKGYPDLELYPNKGSKHIDQHLIKFEIEETHELTEAVKEEMVKNLKEISYFYSNKYKRFCLEPCLRYLMGDKIDLEDSLMMEEKRNDSDDSIDGDRMIQEVGTEGWADDLILQQPDMESIQPLYDSSGDEYGSDFEDLIPAVKNVDLMNSADFSNRDASQKDESDVKESSNEPELKFNEGPGRRTFFDTTPIPKGCGALWSHTGKLVCFFIPKTNEDEKENKELQKFNIFKFTDGGFSINTTSNENNNHHHHHHHHHHHNHRHHSTHTNNYQDDSNSVESEPNDDVTYSSSGNSYSDPDNSSSSSDESFTNDWDDILKDDVPSRSRIPGLFKTSIGLGRRYLNDSNKLSSINKFTSHGGTSNYKSSIQDTNVVYKKKSRSNKKNINIVGIFDFSHLLPARYELASEYRVLGDSPENLASYNSKVAQKYGLTEISEIWKILELILIKDVNANDVNPIFWEQMIRTNMVFSKGVEDLKAALPSGNRRFFWGNHPFGHTWLIKEIFKYFEAKGNIQMLAMMACILFENSANIKNRESEHFNIPVHTPYQVLPPVPSLVSIHHVNEAINRPMNLRDVRGSFDAYSQSSNRESLLLRNLARTTYSQSISSSVEVESVRDDSSSINIRKYNEISPPSYGMSLQNDFGRDIYLSPLMKPKVKNYSVPSFVRQKANQKRYIPHNGSRPPPTVTIEMLNTASLDIYEDEYTSSLLSSQDTEKLKIYRDHYAELLYVWGLPINRIKILKFNYPEQEKNIEVSSPYEEHKCNLGFRNKSLQDTESHTINAITTIKCAKKNPWNGNKNKLKYCNLCGLIITKNLVVCINCEHVLHSHCALLWWSDMEEEKTLECPSGCGCQCLNYTV